MTNFTFDSLAIRAGMASRSSKPSTSFDDLDDALAGAGAAPVSAAEMRRRASMVNGGDSAMVACPKCRGTGMTRWGPCFSCQGKGKRTVRSVAASKAVQTAKVNRAAAMDAFHAEHADLVAFLHANASWSGFFSSLCDQLLERPLSEKQIAAVRSAMAKIAATKAAKAEARAAARPEVDMSAIRKLFDTAVDNRLKTPIFRAGDIEISKDREVGTATLWVRELDKGAWLGKVEGSKFNAFRAAKPDTLATLEAVAANPTEAVLAFALKHKRCSCCGIALRAGVSIAAAVGPICAEKWGLVHLREQAEDDIKAGRL